MLFWKTWTIGNLVYVKTYHTQKSFSGPWPWLHKITFFIPNWYPGTHYPKAKFSIVPSQSNLTHTFSLTGATWTILSQKSQANLNLINTLSLHWGNMNHFGPKRPRQVQIWLKLCPLTGTPHEPSLIQKNLSRQFTLLQYIKSASPTNQGS